VPKSDRTARLVAGCDHLQRHGVELTGPREEAYGAIDYVQVGG
jgi:hypothetical protein